MPNPNTGQPVVELSRISVRYGSTFALDGFDLTVRPGERVGLIGPSGAGKTTVLGVISGLTIPTDGSLTVFGSDPAAMSGRALRRHRADIGIISQQLDLSLPLRVVHNVNMGQLGSWSTGAALWSLIRPSGRASVTAALDQVELADRIDGRTDELSGGERQRVAVARVLLQRPRLVLADEPTSSVDPHLSELVMGRVCEPVGPDEGVKPAVIVSAHDPALIRRHVDRLLGLRDGRTVFDLAVSEVSDELVAELYDEHSTIS
ncbi:MAG: phosphonate ABC transporter ATP-binding protein [Acidimicrobiales bacterium]